jgi:hypothetical protein
MKRLVCAALVAGAAFASAPAEAAIVDVNVYQYGSVVGVGVGFPHQPLVGASVDTATAQVCAGFSLQRPVCTPAL